MQESLATPLAIARKHWTQYVLFFLSHAIVFLLVMYFLVAVSDRFARILSFSFEWLIATSFVWFFITLYLDRWIITEHEILAVDQVELFDRTEAHILMNRIQDVKWEKKGIIQDMFGYGKLTIQDAAEDKEFVLDNVAHVEEIATLIINKKKDSTSTAL